MKIPTLRNRLEAREKPDGSPVMFQTWRDLLFLHWEIDPVEISSRLPGRLSVDLYEGRCYLGIVPFFMEKVRPRFLPAIPWLSHFLELNVRTYVHDEQGRPGVWFFSLDCNQPLAVEIARRFFHLPYQHASMSAKGDTYSCRRKGQADHAIYHYRVEPPYRTAEPGSLEFFLLERYLLFSQSRPGTLHVGRVHHDPYRFRSFPLDSASLLPCQWEGFQLEGPPVSALVSPGVPVNIHPLEKVAEP
jgi:uncharacterized protein YqjF (DUF2071 family)